MNPSKKFDHEEVRCEEMMDWDTDNLLAGSQRTCCVCIGHDCKEAKEEKERIKKLIKI